MLKLALSIANFRAPNKLGMGHLNHYTKIIFYFNLGLLYPQNITMIQAIQRIPWDHRIGNLYWVYHPRQLPNYKSTNQVVVGWSVNNPGSWVSTRVQRRSMPYEVYYHYHCLNPHQPHYFINLKDQLIPELVISPKVEKSSLGEWSRKEEIRQLNLMKLLVSSITYSSC